MHVETDSGQVNKFITNAVFRQGTDTLYCDSLYQNITYKTIEAFSNVRIAQAGGTEATSNYLKYISAEKIAFMSGSVTLTDGKNRLSCEALTYNLSTKTGVYSQHGELQADSTHVVSDRGQYEVNTKEARFTGHVTITDPQYVTTSQDIGYNTDTRMSRFYAPSKIVGDSGRTRLTASSGYYDSQKGLANFDAHATIWYGDQFIEGDTLYYDRNLGYGYAYGKVIAWDASQLSALYCGRAVYNKRQRTLQATRKPVLMQIKGADTLYIRADTFYSAPDLARSPKLDSNKPPTQITNNPKAVAADSSTTNELSTKKNKRKKVSVATPVTVAIDTSFADTTAPLYFIGYHHVKLFSDSLQGVCDSIVYTQADSTIRMIYNPVAWSRKSQITGDTICLLLDSNRLKHIYVPGNAFVVSLAGPAGTEMYDQVQGKMLRVFFENNEIEHMVVYPNAEAIYYSKEDDGDYLGVSQARSDKMRIFFNGQTVKKIKLEEDVHQTLTPMEQVDIPTTKLSKFKWVHERRPVDK